MRVERPDRARLGRGTDGEVVPARRAIDLPSFCVAGLPVSIAVERASATSLPLSSRNSVTVTTNVIVPPRLPSFS